MSGTITQTGTTAEGVSGPPADMTTTTATGEVADEDTDIKEVDLKVSLSNLLISCALDVIVLCKQHEIFYFSCLCKLV